MSGADKRLDRLYLGLTATERALLVLQAVKENRDADPMIAAAVPDAQRAQYSRLIRLMNGLNGEVASVVFILHEQADKVALRLAWLQTLQFWGEETHVLGRLALARGNSLAAGVRRDVRTLLKRAPSFEHVPFDLERPLSEKPVTGDGFGDELARTLAVAIQRGLLQHWCEIRAVEMAVEEAREEFDGEDPLHPDVRRLLVEAKGTLVEVHERLQAYAGEVALSEPQQDLVNVRLLIAKVIEKA